VEYFYQNFTRANVHYQLNPTTEQSILLKKQSSCHSHTDTSNKWMVNSL